MKTNGNSFDLITNVGEPFHVVLNTCCTQFVGCFMKHFLYSSGKINLSEKPNFQSITNA